MHTRVCQTTSKHCIFTGCLHWNLSRNIIKKWLHGCLRIQVKMKHNHWN